MFRQNAELDSVERTAPLPATSQWRAETRPRWWRVSSREPPSSRGGRLQSCSIEGDDQRTRALGMGMIGNSIVVFNQGTALSLRCPSLRHVTASRPAIPLPLTGNEPVLA